MDPEPARLSMSPLYVQPNNYCASDGKGNSYFVSDTSDDSYDYDKKLMFDAVSRKPSSRFILFGIGVATTSDKDYLVYEDGAPWKSKTTEDMRYRTREFICSLHHLHYELNMCHQNIKYETEKSLVVSRSLGSGKLAGMVGCEECRKNLGKKELCKTSARTRDVRELVYYINTSMSAYIDPEFRDFLSEKDCLMKLVSLPAEVICEHPIWIAHPANKLFSRSLLNRRFQPFIDWAMSDDELKRIISRQISYKYPQLHSWRPFVKSTPNLNSVFTYHGFDPYPEFKEVIKEIKNVARFGRNASEHCATSNYSMLEEHLRQMMPHFRTFMFRLMAEHKSNFEDWNLVKIT